jgi:hypothetical protein
MDGDEIPLAHEFLALMLRTRLPGVTVALQLLENRTLICLKGSLIEILDRAGLIAIANGFYGFPEAGKKAPLRMGRSCCREARQISNGGRYRTFITQPDFEYRNCSGVAS